MALNTPMACLVFSDKQHFMTALEVEEQAELSSVDSGSTYELLAHTTVSLNPKSTLDEPSVSPTTSANAILNRNRYRYAKSELGLYLLMTSLAPTEETEDVPCPLPQGYYYSSEESEVFTSDIPAHLYTPKPLPMMQRLRNWWRYR
ncbi:hypothetical protein PCANC_04779 [Puccinia coronata f. sp. avenae]|jgi:hypothetical protein|uniref:Uncharacterized protein n=1 Tax=Puccinia coronata f. sp. avenae TaxID=200324 RepID=A0A2N5SCE8_9BASI|nr:hypothetical protein PCANC_17412 [Puccinia coronata f. sp. avenae]PLW54413.1 hypothetical protein PCANC_04779 [Puccinia coronata f. sp. avenae]